VSPRAETLPPRLSTAYQGRRDPPAGEGSSLSAMDRAAGPNSRTMTARAAASGPRRAAAIAGGLAAASQAPSERASA
jgi:hypothetical protein